MWHRLSPSVLAPLLAWMMLPAPASAQAQAGPPVSAPAPAAAPGAALARMAWLAGCWAGAGEPGSVEQWLAPAGGAMLGMARTVKGGRTVLFEFMRLGEQPSGELVFTAWPNGRGETHFPATLLQPGHAVFENTGHDFPQRVSYRQDGPDRVAARIEGRPRGAAPDSPLRGIDFPLRRVPCDAGG